MKISSLVRYLLATVFGPNARFVANGATRTKNRALASVRAAEKALRDTKVEALADIKGAKKDLACELGREAEATTLRDKAYAAQIGDVEKAGEKTVTALLKQIERTEDQTDRKVTGLRTSQATADKASAGRVSDAQRVAGELDAAAAALTGAAN